MGYIEDEHSNRQRFFMIQLKKATNVGKLNKQIRNKLHFTHTIKLFNKEAIYVVNMEKQMKRITKCGL